MSLVFENVIWIVTKDNLNKEVSKVVRKGFINALNKLGLGSYADGKSQFFKVNIFGDKTDRYLRKIKIEEPTVVAFSFKEKGSIKV